ncbi:hypothetical protein EIN_377800, partial [Entamoeba invadens IP1]
MDMKSVKKLVYFLDRETSHLLAMINMKYSWWVNHTIRTLPEQRVVYSYEQLRPTSFYQTVTIAVETCDVFTFNKNCFENIVSVKIMKNRGGAVLNTFIECLATQSIHLEIIDIFFVLVCPKVGSCTCPALFTSRFPFLKKLFFRQVNTSIQARMTINKICDTFKTNNQTTQLAFFFDSPAFTQEDLYSGIVKNTNAFFVIQSFGFLLENLEMCHHNNILLSSDSLKVKVDCSSTFFNSFLTLNKLYLFSNVSFVTKSNDLVDLNFLENTNFTLVGKIPMSNTFLSKVHELTFCEMVIPPFNDIGCRDISMYTALTKLYLTTKSSLKHLPFLIPNNLKVLVLNNTFVNSFTELGNITEVSTLRTLRVESMNISEITNLPKLPITKFVVDKCSFRVRQFEHLFPRLSTFKAQNCMLFIVEQFPNTLTSIKLKSLMSPCCTFDTIHLVSLCLNKTTFLKQISLPTSLQFFSMKKCNTPEKWNLSQLFLLTEFRMKHCCSKDVVLPTNLQLLQVLKCDETTKLENLEQCNLVNLKVNLNSKFLSRIHIPFNSVDLFYEKEKDVMFSTKGKNK